MVKSLVPSIDVLRQLRHWAFCVAALTSVAATAATLPVDSQAIILKKVFHYDRSLPGNEAPSIWVVLQKPSEQASAAEAVKAFAALGFPAKTVELKNLHADKAPSAVFLLSLPESSAVADFCGKQRVLSIASQPDIVRAGAATLGIGAKDSGKPDILIHRKRMKEDGHDFAAELLSLATVVG